MSNVIDLLKDFKSEVEAKQFIEKQHSTITSLLQKNKQLEEEITHLKSLLMGQEYPVERIIITPEEALIDRQIELIQLRGLERELTLEDTKKLDLLIKNKRLSKEQSTAIQGEVKKIDKKNYSSAELIQIALTKKDSKSDST